MKYFLCIIMFLFSEAVLANTGKKNVITYNQLHDFIVENNTMVKALKYEVQATEEMQGHLVRSFLPKVNAQLGKESFEKKSLTSTSSNYLLVDSEIELFSGLKDYWKNKELDADHRISQTRKDIAISELVYLARKSYIELAKVKEKLLLISDSLAQLKKVELKVQRKVKSGLVSNTDLQLIRIQRALYKANQQSLMRNLKLWSARLSSMLPSYSGNLDDIDSGFLTEFSSMINIADKVNTWKMELYKMKAEKFKFRSASAKGQVYPVLGVYFNYREQPYSEVANLNSDERKEWMSGIRLTWNLGDSVNGFKKAQSFSLKSKSLESSYDYVSIEEQKTLNALVKNINNFKDSDSFLKKEIQLSKKFYQKMGAEYLRGVRSSSDLISAFNQMLQIQSRRLDLGGEYMLTVAEIEKRTCHKRH